jgi:PRC-barrel domain
LSILDEMDVGSLAPELVDRGDKTKGRETMLTFGASAQHVLSCLRPGRVNPVIVFALAALAAQPSAMAATGGPGLMPWRSAEATPSPKPSAAAPSQQSKAAAPSQQSDEKTKEEKTSVPATVIDGEQLESVLGIQALSANGDDMGRIVDIIVDRSGQVRAAIIDFGGFLGVGSRKIAVDWRSLHFNPKKAGAVVVDLTKDQLRVAPVYKPAEPVVMVGGPSAKP